MPARYDLKRPVQSAPDLDRTHSAFIERPTKRFNFPMFVCPVLELRKIGRQGQLVNRNPIDCPDPSRFGFGFGLTVSRYLGLILLERLRHQAGKFIVFRLVLFLHS